MLAINAAMFFIEIGAGLAAASASLLADALDFLGDANSYIISLAVVGMALRYRAMAALAKGLTMGAFAFFGDRHDGLARHCGYRARFRRHGCGRVRCTGCQGCVFRRRSHRWNNVAR